MIPRFTTTDVGEPSHAGERRWPADFETNVNSRRPLMRVVLPTNRAPQANRSSHGVFNATCGLGMPKANDSTRFQIQGGLTVTRFVVYLLIGSIGSLVWMWIGGLITYAPGAVTPNKMQNIYLSRILWYGSLSCVLQLAAIALIVAGRKRSTYARKIVEQ
jgi:hypothetical protein